jgi:Ca-activated chloride channel family protein
MLEALLSNFHWLRPWWLLATIPAIALTILWAKRRAVRSHWQGSVDPELLSHLLEPTPTQQARLPAWALAGAFALGGLGLAGPTWERLPQPVEQANDALVIVLDLSLSMFAEDVPPSRLVRARQEITDVLRQRREGFSALVAYAGDAHTVAPLTDDTKTIENLLISLSPAMMPVLGSNVGTALTLAHELFANAGMSQGRILLVTDSVDRMGDVSEHARKAFPISILGVGTANGGPIPLDFANQPGRQLQTNDGDVIIAKLDTERLTRLADLSHGTYQTAVIGDTDINRALATQLPNDADLQESDRRFDTWADRGYWLVLAALPLLVLLFRRGLLACSPLALLPYLALGLLAPPPANAGIWEDLWQRRDQQGHQQLIEGQPETAAILFENPDWAATADYRSGNYPKAAEHYAKESDATNKYNLANSTARLRDYPAAISLYEQVLSISPDHADAQFNKELLEKLQSEQQQASDQENNEEQDQGGEQGDQERDSQQSGEPEESADQQEQSDAESDSDERSQEEQEASEGGEPEADEQTAEAEQSRDEDTDALEQWLRRVPDDPGGLLKRKFQYETKQRLRQGDYRNRETEKIW